MHLHFCQALQSYHTPHLSIFGDARLFNRDQLLATLNLDLGASDLEIIANLYRRHGWQHHCKHLNGQYGYVVHDKKESRFTLVRDQLGCTPLYYCVDNQGLFVSNQIKVIAVQKSCGLNQTVMLEWLENGSVFNQQETFFSNIHKVPKSTVLQIHSEGHKSYQYWQFPERSPVPVYEEGDVGYLKHLLGETVKCRVAANGIVAAHSSGGLDSSPIAIMANAYVTSRQAPMHTFNWCNPQATNDYNHEWDDARQVAKMAGFSHHEIGITAQSLKHTLLNHNLALDGTAMWEYEKHVLALAGNVGITQIFSGFGGDECLTSRLREHPFNAIRNRQYTSALRSVWLQSDKRKSLSQLRAFTSFLRLLQKAYSPKQKLSNRTLQAEQRRIELRRALLNPQILEQPQDPTQWFVDFVLADTIYEKQRIQLENGYHQERMETWYNMGRQYAIEYAYPYLDTRLIEFALSLSSDCYYRDGMPRYLYYKALQGVVPDFLLNKPKLPEKVRVTHAIHQRHNALTDDDVLDHVQGIDSVFIDKKTLISRMHALRKLDPQSVDFEFHANEVAALNNAILAMNVEHYFASSSRQAQVS